MFILKITNEDKNIRITEDEAKVIANTPDDKSVAINRLGIVVQKRMVMVFPEESPDIKEGQETGVLHDGVRVKKHFGSWVDATAMFDGKPVRIDPQYYPEVALDKVPTEWEWENKYKQLPKEERKEAICGHQMDRIEGQKMERLGEITKK